MPSQIWQCGNCTLDNAARSKKCRVCNARRTDGQEPTADENKLLLSDGEADESRNEKKRTASPSRSVQKRRKTELASVNDDKEASANIEGGSPRDDATSADDDEVAKTRKKVKALPKKSSENAPPTEHVAVDSAEEGRKQAKESSTKNARKPAKPPGKSTQAARKSNDQEASGNSSPKKKAGAKQVARKTTVRRKQVADSDSESGETSLSPIGALPLQAKTASKAGRKKEANGHHRTLHKNHSSDPSSDDDSVFRPTGSSSSDEELFDEATDSSTTKGTDSDTSGGIELPEKKKTTKSASRAVGRNGRRDKAAPKRSANKAKVESTQQKLPKAGCVKKKTVEEPVETAVGFAGHKRECKNNYTFAPVASHDNEEQWSFICDLCLSEAEQGEIYYACTTRACEYAECPQCHAKRTERAANTSKPSATRNQKEAPVPDKILLGICESDVDRRSAAGVAKVVLPSETRRPTLGVRLRSIVSGSTPRKLSSPISSLPRPKLRCGLAKPPPRTD